MSLPKISIVTPSYNQGQYLEQTIDSVLSQSYRNKEYIIIDGGSTDNSVEIIKKYERHIHYWVSEQDKGQSAAINKGLVKASGEVFNWINSDDYYQPNAFTVVGEAFRDSSIKVVCAKSQIVKDNRVVKISSGTDIYSGNLAKTIGWARIDQPETFFRLETFRQVGLLTESLHYVMDKEFWIRFLLINGLEGVRKLDEVIVSFRLHDLSKTTTQIKNFDQESFQIYQTLAASCGMGEILPIAGFNLKKVINASVYSRDYDLVKQIVNYYLFYQFLRNYAINDFNKANKIAQVLDTGLLKEEDSKEFSKVRNRMKYPVLIKRISNFLNNLRSN